MASKEELFNSICPTMKLTKDFFKRVYGHELTYPGFADQAISKLEAAGCSNARRYYDDWVSKFETDWNVMMKSVAKREGERFRNNIQRKEMKRNECKRTDYEFDGLPQDW